MLTENQIKFLNRVCPNRWVEENNVINVEGNVDISRMNLIQIPVQFGQVNGYFYCKKNKLTTLKGSPSIIIGSFNCDENKLSTLEGGTKECGGSYSCALNKLTSLIEAPEICNDDFYCFNNQLTSLEECPKLIKGNLYCRNNPNLEYLWGIGQVFGKIYYERIL